MWTRTELKERAKTILRKNYWNAFLISIVIAIAGGSNGSTGSGGGSSGQYTGSHPFLNFEIRFSIFVISVAGFFLLYRIFIGYALEVGGRRYFVRTAQSINDGENFRFAFTGGNYAGILGTMFLRALFTFLWFLLLIIPGIVKTYAYSMVPYILADNPRIGADEAIRLSNEMTRGHKWEMFVLDLSFIGWYILGAIALGIGVFFVNPYYDATKAELYLVLRRNAIENRLCSEADLQLGLKII